MFSTRDFGGFGAGFWLPLIQTRRLILIVFLAFQPVLASASEVTVAVAGPTSGPNADRSLWLWSGAKEAVAQINAQGGIKGVPLKLIREDDGCSTKGAVAAATALADRRIDLVIGHPCAGPAAHAAVVYGARSTLFIATSTRHPMLTDRRAGGTIFRISGRDDAQAGTAAQYLLDHSPSQRFAIVHDRTRFARGLAEGVAKRLTLATGKAPIIATLISGEKAFPQAVAKIKDADMIFFAGFPVEAGLLYSELRRAGGTGAVLFSDSVGSGEFGATFGHDIRDALVLSARFGPDLSAHIGGDVDGRLHEGDAGNAKIAIQAFAAAANRAATLSAESISIILNGYLLDLGARKLRFSQRGDAERPSYDIFKWTGQSWEAIGSDTSSHVDGHSPGLTTNRQETAAPDAAAFQDTIRQDMAGTKERDMVAPVDGRPKNGKSWEGLNGSPLGSASRENAAQKDSSGEPKSQVSN